MSKQPRSVFYDIFPEDEAQDLEERAVVLMGLQNYFEKHELSQADVQQITGMNPSDVSFLVNGKISRFDLPRLIKIAKLFKARIDLKVTFPSPTGFGAHCQD